MRIELLWFEGCPNHELAAELLREVLDDLQAEATVVRVEVPDEETGKRVCFPGSPTIRVDGTDIEPGWERCEDCTPRCRVYLTPEGLRGLPPRAWIEEAVVAAGAG